MRFGAGGGGSAHDWGRHVLRMDGETGLDLRIGGGGGGSHGLDPRLCRRHLLLVLLMQQLVQLLQLLQLLMLQMLVLLQRQRRQRWSGEAEGVLQYAHTRERQLAVAAMDDDDPAPTAAAAQTGLRRPGPAPAARRYARGQATSFGRQPRLPA